MMIFKRLVAIAAAVALSIAQTSIAQSATQAQYSNTNGSNSPASVQLLPDPNSPGKTVPVPVDPATGYPIVETLGGSTPTSVTAAIGAFVDGAITTIGAEADAAWSSGSGTVISLLKSIAGNTVPPYAPIQTQFVQRPANTTTYTASTAWNTATSGSSPGYLTFTNVCRTNGGAVYLNDVNILDSANQTLKLSGVIWLYDTAPAVINDDVAYNIAFSLTGSPPAQTITGDLANSKPPIAFTMSNVANAGSGASGAMEQDVPVNAIYHCASGDRNLYEQTEVTNAYVPVASEVLGIRIKYTALN